MLLESRYWVPPFLYESELSEGGVSGSMETLLCKAVRLCQLIPSYPPS